MVLTLTVKEERWVEKMVIYGVRRTTSSLPVCVRVPSGVLFRPHQKTRENKKTRDFQKHLIFKLRHRRLLKRTLG